MPEGLRPSRDPSQVSEGWPTALIRHRAALVVAAHGMLFALALLSAFMLAYNFRWTVTIQDHRHPWMLDLYLPLLGLALPIKLLVFHWCREYHGSWRYVGLRDLMGVIRAALISTFLFLTVYFGLENVWLATTGHTLIDRWPWQYLRQSSVFALDWAATVAFVAAARVLVRFYHEESQPRRATDPLRVLICGAGDGGEAVLREVLRVRRDQYHVVGFLDDEVPHLHGRIHDVEVVGRLADLREMCERYEVDEVFIALPRAAPKEIRALVERCEGLGARFRTIPAMTDVIEGRVRVSRLRDVDIADLLGREAVRLDTDRIAEEIAGRRVLVTGAGGSIGSEMCRQIASYGPARLVLVEHAENNLFEIERELRQRFPRLEALPCVADITDRERMRSVFERESPSIVFHAAAHKHVPMMECNPGEALKNNVLGTAAIADIAVASGAQKMVMISTDKAVNPTSVMGCTKRVAEMYVQGLNGKSSTQFVTVRFGNVLGSSGSVVPIFQRQIAEGGPVTVTHPDMTRYFMTIVEAAQLVLQAGAMGKGGEIYVLHMGEPVRIADLARDMITLSGLRPGVDIDIVFTGKRPGEKLFEELNTEGEHIGDTAHPKIGIWKHRPTDFDSLREGIERVMALVDVGEDAEIVGELKRLVPEYTPEESGPCEAPKSSPAAPVGA